MKKLLFYSLMFLLAACGGDSDNGQTVPPGGQPVSKVGVLLSVDKNYINADGEDAASFRILFTDDKGFTYDVGEQAELLCNGEKIQLEELRFTSLEEGDFSFNADYNNYRSNTVKVSVVHGIASLPADSDPSNFSFKHRMLLVQHTGNTCPNCPRMMNLLKSLSEDEAYNTLYHQVASHSYNKTDKAYSGAAVLLSREFNLDGFYPWLTFDYTTDYEHEISAVKSYIDQHHRAETATGLSAAVSLVDDRLSINVGVKVATSGNYRIAVWILEDNIKSNQSGATASWHHIHHNCLREMLGDNKTTRIYGTPLGDLDSGETVNYITAALLVDSWVAENCKAMILTSARGSDGEYHLVNCTVCAPGETVSYEYN